MKKIRNHKVHINKFDFKFSYLFVQKNQINGSNKMNITNKGSDQITAPHAIAVRREP